MFILINTILFLTFVSFSLPLLVFVIEFLVALMLVMHWQPYSDSNSLKIAMYKIVSSMQRINFNPVLLLPTYKKIILEKAFHGG